MWNQLLPFLAAAFAIELTPGPNMAYLALLSAQHGRSPGFAAVAGIALGLLAAGVLSLLGLGALVQANPPLYEALRWAGVGYLLWLAWDCWRDASTPLRDGEQASPMQALRRALITNLLNPKGYLFYLTVLPGFVASEAGYQAEALILTLIYVMVATTVHLGVVAGSSTLTRFLQRPERRRATGAVFALLLVAVAIWLAARSGL